MLWLVVVLVLVIGAAGDVATRALGGRFGLPFADFASGFISSAATIGSMAGLAAKESVVLKTAVAAATLSTVATFIQLALLFFAISPTPLTPALISGGIAATIYGLVFTTLAIRSTDALNVNLDAHSVLALLSWSRQRWL